VCSGCRWRSRDSIAGPHEFPAIIEEVVLARITAGLAMLVGARSCGCDPSA